MRSIDDWLAAQTTPSRAEVAHLGYPTFEANARVGRFGGLRHIGRSRQSH
jgi:hypothetical protein